MPFLGTLVNCGAVACGGLLGIFLSILYLIYVTKMEKFGQIS